MKKNILVMTVAAASLVTFLVWLFSSLIMLLTQTGGQDLIPRLELDSPVRPGPALIPQIIHQVYKNDTIPERWLEPRQQCLDQHKNYTFYLWTDDKARAFVADKFPDSLAMYDNYPFWVQRADSIRYFVLAYYGGTYIDLDDGCARSLEPLNAYPAWLHRTQPTGISNDVMGARADHPFWRYVIAQLPVYARSWGPPYLTVMYSTGPLFLSVLWEQWIRSGNNIENGRLRVLGETEYRGEDWSFFYTFGGSSWHGSDVALLVWTRAHWLALVFAGLSFVVVGVMLVRAACYVFARRARSFRGGLDRGEYELLKGET